MRVWLPPMHIERRYGRFLKKNVLLARAEFLRRLGEVINLQRRKYNPVMAEGADEIAQEVEAVLQWWKAQEPEKSSNFAGYFLLVNLFNDTQFLAVVKDATGLTLPPTIAAGFKSGLMYSGTADMLKTFGESADVYRAESFLPAVRDNWVATQKALLERTIVQAVRDAEMVVRDATVTSMISSKVRAAIESIFTAAGNRVLARGAEEISSANTVLTRQRQISLNLKDYVWETVRDERVRGNPTGLYPNAKPSHFARQGHVFSWTRPPEGGHPGEAWGCRCWARPIFHV